MTDSLRIALVAPPQSEWEDWQWHCLAALFDDPDVEITAMISLKVTLGKQGKSANWRDRLSCALLKKYEGVRSRKLNKIDPMAKESVLDKLFHIPVVDLSHDLSVLACDLIFSFYSREEVNKAVTLKSRKPLLYIVHADPQKYANDPAWTGFREMRHQDHVVGAVVIGMQAGSAKDLITQGALIQAFYSTAQRWGITAARVQDLSVALVLDEIQKFSETRQFDFQALPDRFFQKSSQPRAKDVFAYLKQSCAHDWRTATARFRKPEQWRLLLGKGDLTQARFADLMVITPPETEYWADPFLWPGENETSCYVFFENDSFATPKGKISVGKIEDGQFTFLGDALERPYHLSFPFLFEDEGQLYMIPETHQSQQIEIWKCDDFPLKWTLHKTLLQGQSCVDSSVIKYEGAYWLFTNISRGRSFQDHQSELFIFKSPDSSFQTLEPHALNPVCRDVRFARNGGRVFIKNGQLFRFGQNNAGRYGYSLSLMQIDMLTLSAYAERDVYSIPQDFYQHVKAVHHCDFRGDFFIFDGLFAPA